MKIHEKDIKFDTCFCVCVEGDYQTVVVYLNIAKNEKSSLIMHSETTAGTV